MLAFAMRQEMTRLLQENLNHARQAQDLFVHTLAELDCGLGVIAEPYRVPATHPCWASDLSGLAALTWRETSSSPPCRHRESGHGFVAVDWGPMSVIAVYVSPNVSQTQFEDWLDDVRECARQCAPRPLIVAGDFNAKSGMWGYKRTG